MTCTSLRVEFQILRKIKLSRGLGESADGCAGDIPTEFRQRDSDWNWVDVCMYVCTCLPVKPVHDRRRIANVHAFSSAFRSYVYNVIFLILVWFSTCVSIIVFDRWNLICLTVYLVFNERLFRAFQLIPLREWWKGRGRGLTRETSDTIGSPEVWQEKSVRPCNLLSYIVELINTRLCMYYV